MLDFKWNGCNMDINGYKMYISFQEKLKVSLCELFQIFQVKALWLWTGVGGLPTSHIVVAYDDLSHAEHRVVTSKIEVCCWERGCDQKNKQSET